MRFELIGKQKATLTDIDPQSLKQGQTDLKPAVALTIKVTMANTSMNMLGKTLRAFFYEKAPASKEVQGTLDGVPPVSDLAALTEAAKWLGAQQWAEEQTGCQLVVHLGVSTITLKDGTLQKLRFEPKEGGAVDWRFVFYTSTDIDAETLGDLCVLKNHDVDIELTGPEIISSKQKSIEEPAGKEKKSTAAPASPFIDQPSNTVVTIKGRKGKGGLGTDEDQAARQAEVLAKDPTQVVSKDAWPFPNPEEKAQTPEQAFAGTAT